MKSFLLLSALSCSVSAANHLIVGVGSSYAAGPGVAKTIDKNLQELFTNSNYFGAGVVPDRKNFAVIGSVLKNITEYQAPKNLTGLSPDLIFMLSGGNDLAYVTCIGNEAKCPASVEPEDRWQRNFTAALDAIFKAVANPTKVKLYVVTYPTALGPATQCSNNPVNPACPLSSNGVTKATALYDAQVQYTTDSLAVWRNVSSNSQFQTILIPMKGHSQASPGHEVGSQSPWMQGANSTGAPWHPNDAGTLVIAQYIYSNFTK